ncbi:hypothetical protein I4U23_021911 [Adineta vaga]|nr:hypothetical protein I4U23_021911 [Adineta vaga]
MGRYYYNYYYYAQKDDPKASLVHYQTASQLHSKLQMTGRAMKLLPMIYSNIDYSYLLLKDWKASMRMFEKALQCLSKLDHPDEQLRGSIYLNMAIVELSQNNTQVATTNCDKASISWKKCLPDDHTNFSRPIEFVVRVWVWVWVWVWVVRVCVVVDVGVGIFFFITHSHPHTHPHPHPHPTHTHTHTPTLTLTPTPTP